MVSNKIDDKITKVSQSSPQNSLETVESETKNKWFDREIPKEWYVSPKKKKQIINVRLINIII